MLGASARQLKHWVPAPLRPFARKVYRRVRGILAPDGYADRVHKELEIYNACAEVHDLPAIAHYWSNKYLVPMLRTLGFSNPTEMFRKYIARACIENSPHPCSILSIGAGGSTIEIAIAESLLADGIRNFHFECVDINPALLERGSRVNAEKGLQEWLSFSEFDVNAWNPRRSYHVILASQCLHDFVELELLFKKIRQALEPDGFFLVDDMIGRNGHQRWPEALRIVRQLWRELPDKYKYNRGTGQVEKEYENTDASVIGFEGVRAQDILPLLLMHFHFEVFIGFANIIDPFIDRTFGPNFDPDNAWDRSFIDRVHAFDMKNLEAGTLKPTHMYAVLRTHPTVQTKVFKHLTPGFCVRWPPRRVLWRARYLLRGWRARVPL